MHSSRDMNPKCFNFHSRATPLLVLVIDILISILIILGAKSECAPSHYPRPVLVGVFHEINELNASMDVVVQGQFAFLGTAGGRLSSIDVSNPSRPQEIGYTNLVGLFPIPMGIAIHQNYVYVATHERPGISHLEIFDVSMPDSPQSVGILNLNADVIAVAVKDDIAYISDGITGDVMVIDVSDPTDPTYIRSVDTELAVFNIYIHDNLAFLANSGLGVSVLDISAPPDPIFLATLTLSEGVVYDVAAKGQYVYIPYDVWTSPNSQFLVVDASNPAQMEIIDSLEVDPIPAGIAVNESVAAITIQEGTFDGNLLLIDLSDPVSPRKGGSANVPNDGPQGPVVIQDNLVYVVTIGGLAIYEIVYE